MTANGRISYQFLSGLETGKENFSIAVLDALAGEQFMHGPGHAFVPLAVPAAAAASRADSERSKTRQAIALVTVGKQSRNSASE